MINEEDMEKAINELNAQLLSNYRQVSEKYSLIYIMLIRRFLGLCTSRQETISLYYKLLIDIQEEALNWIAHFVKYYSNCLKMIDNYNIIAGNIYNWDEKGFLISLVYTLKCIITKKLYNSNRIILAVQDSSREFISLLASICTDGIALPPALIYKGISGDLQDTWLEDLNEKYHINIEFITTYNRFKILLLILPPYSI
ncbi:hypothetical protein NA56DRAFT_726749 [Hyaloscypha hepaticicola]|uniref:DDE-1 domain-containing protein n=1 Tax=Hyaloscypha hepaticicola TaxID=2082293 RepID=A0A2J6PX92_9HELO|nr:hypothetical protein NA56DRAFT_726749 [Hyaloscypha hepaticicola]